MRTVLVSMLCTLAWAVATPAAATTTQARADTTASAQANSGTAPAGGQGRAPTNSAQPVEEGEQSMLLLGLATGAVLLLLARRRFVR